MTGLLRPRPGEHAAARFHRIAAELIFRSILSAGGRLVALREIEFYLHSPAHPDPFVHRHPLQRLPARWYFHRVGSGYRGGTFKGLDLTFGSRRAFGGILIRALQLANGETIRGPCRVVDRVLALTGHATAAALDAAIAGRRADDPRSPLHLVRQRDSKIGDLHSGPRVGLSMARATPGSGHDLFRIKPYRFWL